MVVGLPGDFLKKKIHPLGNNPKDCKKVKGLRELKPPQEKLGGGIDVG